MRAASPAASFAPQVSPATQSLAEYESLVLAREPQRLAALRIRLEADRRKLPLFNRGKRARELENLMGEWPCRGDPARLALA